MQRIYSIDVLAFFVLLLLTSATAHGAFTQDPALSWKTLHTPHFHINYHDGESNLAKELAGIAEQVHSQLSVYLDWQPAVPTEVILTDRMDFSNGWAIPFPRNTMTIIASPPDELNSLEDYDNWLRLVFVHEYTHVLHLDKVFGMPQFLRRVFGRIEFSFPNIFQPSWVLEGLATYVETDAQRGVGRGQNTAFKTLMRIEVENGIKPITQVNQPMVSWPAGNSAYLYGVYFMNFLRDRYGDDKLRNWIYQYSNNFFWFINQNARYTLGKDFNQLWLEFGEYLEEQFRPGIDRIKADGVNEGVNISHAGYYTGYPRTLPNGDLYYIRNDYASHPKLMLLKKGAAKPREFMDSEGEHFDLHPTAGILMAKIDLTKSVNYFSDLYRIDFHKHETRLTKGKRYTYATWSPDGQRIAAVHNEAGNKALHLLSSNGEFIESLWQGTDKEVIAELDWSPDGKSLVASVWRPTGHWNLEEFSLQSKTWRKLTDTDFIEGQPQYTPDGSAILFCADYNGVFNVMRLDLQSGDIYSLTNLLGGAFAVTPAQQGQGIFYMGINSNGHDVYYLAELRQAAISGTPSIPAVDKIAGPLQSITADTGYNPDKARITPYNALAKLKPTAWLPTGYINEDDDITEVGFTTYGTDPLNRHMYSLYYVYDFNKGISSGRLDYIYDRWNPSLKLSFQRDALRYYQSNKLRRIRLDQSVTGELIFPLLKRDHQWTFHLGLVHDRESDWWLDENVGPRHSLVDRLAGMAVSYNSAKAYPKSISFSDGQNLRFVAEDSDALNSDYTGQVYTLDWRGYKSITGEHVLAGRLVGGWGTDYPRPFRLGGDQDGYALGVPSQTLTMLTTDIFNKRNYALRGYDEGLPRLTGRRMALAELEWRFPIVLIERGLMAPPVGIHNIHGKVFYNAGEAWHENFKSANVLQGAGIEVNTEFVIGYLLSLDWRVGYAHGFDEALGDDQFYMLVGGTF